MLVPTPERAEEIELYIDVVPQLKRKVSTALVLVTDAAAEVLRNHPRARIWLGKNPALLSCLLAAATGKLVAPVNVHNSATGHFLFTSGSTGQAKATRISRSSISFNAGYTASSWSIDDSSRVVGFGAPFHSAGLMVGYLMPIVAGASSVLVSPASFKSDPQVLLRAMARFGVTHVSGSDSVFDRLLNRPLGSYKQSDLANLQVAVVGGEPLRAEIFATLVAQLIGRLGRNAELRTAYGMTEAAGLISSSNSIRPSTMEVNLDALSRGQAVQSTAGPRRFVASAGAPTAGVQVAIVDGNGTIQKHGQIGRIVFASPSLFDGYAGVSESPAITLRVSTSREQRSGFFDTGDLGFVDNGELYVVGRAKETIATVGRIIFSVDIEQLAMTADFELPDAVVMAAADPTATTNPGVLLLLEVPVTTSLEDITAAIFNSVQRAYPDVPLRLVIVKPGSLPRIPTSSKKPRLHAAKAFLDGRLPVLLDRYRPMRRGVDKGADAA